jgi:catechol 2,3-dioxygenase-like lactoylglutathione lyase family enzyme
MKGTVYHLQLNVRDAAVSLPFDRDLLGFLEVRAVYDEGGVAGFSDGRTDLWVMGTLLPHREAGFHRQRPGLNHVAFRVAARDDVDRFCRDFLGRRGLPALYDTPRDFPEYAPGYYAVFFEDPDRVKLEVVHLPERHG